MDTESKFDTFSSSSSSLLSPKISKSHRSMAWNETYDTQNLVNGTGQWKNIPVIVRRQVIELRRDLDNIIQRLNDQFHVTSEKSIRNLVRHYIKKQHEWTKQAIAQAQEEFEPKMQQLQIHGKTLDESVQALQSHHDEVQNMQRQLIQLSDGIEDSLQQKQVSIGEVKRSLQVLSRQFEQWKIRIDESIAQKANKNYLEGYATKDEIMEKASLEDLRNFTTKALASTISRQELESQVLDTHNPNSLACHFERTISTVQSTVTSQKDQQAANETHMGQLHRHVDELAAHINRMNKYFAPLASNDELVSAQQVARIVSEKIRKATARIDDKLQQELRRYTAMNDRQMKENLNTISNEMNGKISKHTFNKALAHKVEQAHVRTWLATKVDKSTLSELLDKKADTTQLTKIQKRVDILHQEYAKMLTGQAQNPTETTHMHLTEIQDLKQKVAELQLCCTKLLETKSSESTYDRTLQSPRSDDLQSTKRSQENMEDRLSALEYHMQQLSQPSRSSGMYTNSPTSSPNTVRTSHRIGKKTMQLRSTDVSSQNDPENRRMVDMKTRNIEDEDLTENNNIESGHVPMYAQAIHGRWIWKSQRLSKHATICWDIEALNLRQDYLLWDSDKFTLVKPGLYEVRIGIFSDKQPALSIILNDEVIVQYPQNATNKHGNAVMPEIYKHSAGNVAGFSMLQFLAVPSHATVQICINDKKVGGQGFIEIKKL